MIGIKKAIDENQAQPTSKLVECMGLLALYRNPIFHSRGIFVGRRMGIRPYKSIDEIEYGLLCRHDFRTFSKKLQRIHKAFLWSGVRLGGRWRAHNGKPALFYMCH